MDTYHQKLLFDAYNELISQLKALDFMDSITLIGEPVDKRVLDKVMDIDIIQIVSFPMTIEKYNKIKEIYEEICKKYTTPEIDVIHAIACGPMKPKSFKEYEIFFHCLLFTEESYKELPMNTAKLSWQYHKPIKGKHLKSLQFFEAVTKDLLMNDVLGINNLIKLVSEDSSAYIGWETESENKMKWSVYPLKFEHADEKADLYIYAVLRCASNALRFITKDNSFGIGHKMAQTFAERFPELKSKNLPLDLVEGKKDLRNRRYHDDVCELKKQTLDFLNELKNHVED